METPLELEDNDISSDMYEMIMSINDDFNYNNCMNKERIDNFKIGFENLFNISIDKIEDIEEIIAESSNKENLITIYNVIKNDLIGLFDNYYGITFDTGNDLNNIVDLDLLYMVYRVVYLNIHVTISDVVLGYINKNKLQNEDITEELIKTIIDDECIFTDENINEFLHLGDPGNYEYIKVFGEYSNEENINTDNLISNIVIIDNIVFRNRIKKIYLSGTTFDNLPMDNVSFVLDNINKHNQIN